MRCKQFGICGHVRWRPRIASPRGGSVAGRKGRGSAMNDNATGNEAARALLTKYLHLRMTSEHVNSGGGTCMSPRIQSCLPGLRFVGRALTVRTLPGFTRRAIEALSRAKEDDVLVIDAGGPSELSVWGSMVHWNATRNKLGAIVIDGMVRDLLEIQTQHDPIPLFACGRA